MNDVSLLVLWVLSFLATVTFHEVAHGVVARRLGDPTAEERGRLTLNPLKHIDPIWTVALPLALYLGSGGRFALGMAKPVPVDFSRLRNPRKGMVYVALAGPIANILLAAVLAGFYRALHADALLLPIYLNLGIAVFNLLPIPPLDGSRVLFGVLPRPWALAYAKLEPYGFALVLLLHALGILAWLIMPVLALLSKLLGLPVLMG